MLGKTPGEESLALLLGEWWQMEDFQPYLFYDNQEATPGKENALETMNPDLANGKFSVQPPPVQRS